MSIKSFLEGAVAVPKASLVAYVKGEQTALSEVTFAAMENALKAFPDDKLIKSPAIRKLQFKLKSQMRASDTTPTFELINQALVNAASVMGDIVSLIQAHPGSEFHFESIDLRTANALKLLGYIEFLQKYTLRFIHLAYTDETKAVLQGKQNAADVLVKGQTEYLNAEMDNFATVVLWFINGRGNLSAGLKSVPRINVADYDEETAAVTAGDRTDPLTMRLLPPGQSIALRIGKALVQWNYLWYKERVSLKAALEEEYIELQRAREAGTLDTAQRRRIEYAAQRIALLGGQIEDYEKGL